MSNAASSLAAAMKAAGVSQEKLASELGIAGPSVWAWTKGRAKPRPEFRRFLHERFGIEPAAWDEVES